MAERRGGDAGQHITQVGIGLDLLTVVENKAASSWPLTVVSKYDYSYDADNDADGYDAIGRRTSVVMTGSAFGNGHHNDYGYNDRSELATAERKTGTTPGQGTLMTPGDFDYAYDHIGNRASHGLDGTSRYYCANDLNQYTFIDDASGTCPTPPSPTDSFTYDADGNLTGDRVYSYAWDAENRLVCVAPVGTPGSGDKLLAFKYDHKGRRVDLPVPARQTGKTHAVHDGQQWVTQSVQRFVYDEWNIVLVLDDNNATARKYTWGLDLSGLHGVGPASSRSGIHGAGGIGGLLAVEETATTNSPAYWFFYDANGNVGQVVQNTTGYPTVAHYEYDPYGNIIASTGTYAAANPIRFSTKWFDTELASTGPAGATGPSGLGYWGYRYYSPRLGRWVSRDPSEELGGLNLCAFAQNSPTVLVDSNGLKSCQKDKCEVMVIEISNVTIDSIKKEGSILCALIPNSKIEPEAKKQIESKGGRQPPTSDLDCQGLVYNYDKNCFCKCVPEVTFESDSWMPFTVNLTIGGCSITVKGIYSLKIIAWSGSCKKAGG